MKYVASECDLSEESLLKTCLFTWLIVQSTDQKQIRIKFDFKEKAKVSLGDEPDYVLVKFWGAPYILTEDQKPIFKEPFAVRVRIPLQTDPEATSVIATQVMADSIGNVGTILLWIQFGFRIFFHAAMAEIIGMFGFMQLVIYYPLLSLKFPPTALLLYT
jgi:hypothetical protein